MKCFLLKICYLLKFLFQEYGLAFYFDLMFVPLVELLKWFESEVAQLSPSLTTTFNGFVDTFFHHILP